MRHDQFPSIRLQVIVKMVYIFLTLYDIESHQYEVENERRCDVPVPMQTMTHGLS